MERSMDKEELSIDWINGIYPILQFMGRSIKKRTFHWIYGTFHWNDGDKKQGGEGLTHNQSITTP
jgi:hypothetical protein